MVDPSQSRAIIGCSRDGRVCASELVDCRTPGKIFCGPQTFIVGVGFAPTPRYMYMYGEPYFVVITEAEILKNQPPMKSVKLNVF